MLNDTAIRNAKPGARPIKLSDSGGLFLLIQPQGSRLWRMAYRFAGKQKTLAIGSYPTITLKAAREKRDEARRLLADGINPSLQRRPDKQAASRGNTFKVVAEELLKKLARKVDRCNAVGMVGQKRAPALRWWPRVAAHIPSDCRLSDLEAELEQFTMNVWGAPERVRPAHLANERAQLSRDLRSASMVARSPAPIR